MLLANTMRAKAYLQNLIRHNFLPKKVIVLKEEKETLIEEKNRLVFDKNTKQRLIRKIETIEAEIEEKEHIEVTLQNNNIPYQVINTFGVNSKAVEEAVANLPTEYVIYGGPGGIILKKELLSIGKKFLHVHPGNLPLYKGSTTYYYEMLLEKELNCSVIIMSEKLDSGMLLHKKRFDVPKGFQDFDSIVDPLIRADTLIEWMTDIKLNGIQEICIEQEDENVFYIIHPVLKHFSILQARKGN